MLLATAENALEDLVDVLEVIVEVEIFGQLSLGEIRSHFFISAEQA
jgi:hypothetical protein